MSTVGTEGVVAGDRDHPSSARGVTGVPEAVAEAAGVVVGRSGLLS